MARYIKTIKSKPGIAPGTLMYEDEVASEYAKVEAYVHCNGNTIFSELTLDDVFTLVKDDNSFWINVSGTPPLKWFEQLANHTGIHKLTLEDMISTNQRPKLESYQDYNFISLKMLYKAKGKKGGALLEQLSMIQFKNGVITFQSTDTDTFEGVRERLGNRGTKIYKLAPDYTVFCLLDTIVDHYMVIVEAIGQRVDKLEDQLFARLNSEHFIKRFVAHQRELNILRKNIRPVKEIMVQCLKKENPWIENDTIYYYNDVNDHLLLVNETLDTYRDLLSDLLNIHSTQMGNNMNQVMKTLTIFSAVFIPTTFIAGVYGTNFSYLPELQYKYAYPIFWVVLILTAGSMLYYFKKKGWF